VTEHRVQLPALNPVHEAAAQAALVDFAVTRAITHEAIDAVHSLSLRTWGEDRVSSDVESSGARIVALVEMRSGGVDLEGVLRERARQLRDRYASSKRLLSDSAPSNCSQQAREKRNEPLNCSGTPILDSQEIRPSSRRHLESVPRDGRVAVRCLDGKREDCRTSEVATLGRQGVQHAVDFVNGEIGLLEGLRRRHACDAPFDLAARRTRRSRGEAIPRVLATAKAAAMRVTATLSVLGG